ncbi:hypothetical protein Tco_0748582 [Tanacetum coccineum]|uniref:Uncharacterized protein n=1 Tax=Tanacetum coccineum TaxID=301880 RepID=A0ABQ4YX05_9ASTR
MAANIGCDQARGSKTFISLGLFFITMGFLSKAATIGWSRWVLSLPETNLESRIKEVTRSPPLEMRGGFLILESWILFVLSLCRSRVSQIGLIHEVHLIHSFEHSGDCPRRSPDGVSLECGTDRPTTASSTLIGHGHTGSIMSLRAGLILLAIVYQLKLFGLRCPRTAPPQREGGIWVRIKQSFKGEKVFFWIKVVPSIPDGIDSQLEQALISSKMSYPQKELLLEQTPHKLLNNIDSVNRFNSIVGECFSITNLNVMDWYPAKGSFDHCEIVKVVLSSRKVFRESKEHRGSAISINDTKVGGKENCTTFLKTSFGDAVGVEIVSRSEVQVSFGSWLIQGDLALSPTESG